MASASLASTLLLLLLSDSPSAVLVRVLLSTIACTGVRVLLSHACFGGSVVHGTKTVSALHATFQACAVWLWAAQEPAVGARLWQIWTFSSQPDARYFSVQSDAIAILATIAAGEFAMQMLHLRAWYEKPADLITVCHHVGCGLFWPLGVAARSAP